MNYKAKYGESSRKCWTLSISYLHRVWDDVTAASVPQDLNQLVKPK